MKWVFYAAALGLSLLSAVAWRLQPEVVPPGKRPLTWVSDDNPLRKQQGELFNELHPPNQVLLDPNNGDIEKVIVQSIGGVGPDVFDCFDGFQLAAYVKSGVALDVTDLLRSHGIDVRAQTYPGVSAVSVYDGRVYGVPTNIAADGIWFHKDLFDEAGLPYPHGPITWKELIPIAQKLTKRDATGRVTRFGLLLPWWNWRHIFDGFGAEVFSPDGTSCILNRPAAIAAVQMMHDLVYKYHVSPSPADAASMASQGGFGSSDINVFSARRAAMALGGRWWLSQLRSVPGLKLGVSESPYATVRQFRAYGRGTLVNRNSRNLQGALAFLLYEASPDYNRLINKQADSISAFPAYDQGPAFLQDPDHPEETYNAVWRDIARRSVPDAVSLFVDGNVVSRLLQKQFDLVQGDLKSPAQAMADATREVNAEIQKTLQVDPTLAARYRQLTSGGVQP